MAPRKDIMLTLMRVPQNPRFKFQKMRNQTLRTRGRTEAVFFTLKIYRSEFVIGEMNL